MNAYIIIAISLFLIFLSVYIVEQQSAAVVQKFSRFIKISGSGLSTRQVQVVI